MPYSVNHVPTYHEWMSDAELQAATASEPLTVEEEYEMQQSWRTDNDKLTFIVCQSREPTGNSAIVQAGVEDCAERMIGDINLFLFEPEDDDDDDGANDNGIEASNDDKASQAIVGEIELMIARKDLHRQGYGRAALLAFTSYILNSWDRIATEYSSAEGKSPRALEYLRVKINQTNARSIALFQSIGFIQTAAGANYFGEVELRWQPDQAALKGCKGWEETKQLQYADK